MISRMGIAVLALALVPVGARAQARSILGTWEAKADAEVHKIVIRPDSSASYGTETVRWRTTGDTIKIALGGEWVCYRLHLRGNKMTLSEGDLTEPITLRRVGKYTARPDSIPVPDDPLEGEEECI